MENGVVFTQDGVPIRGSADYQKVLDSRWRFIEQETEIDFDITLPSDPGAPSFDLAYWQNATILTHGLGFFPLIEVQTDQVSEFPNFFEVVADKSKVYLRRRISDIAYSAFRVTGKVRVYNLPITEEYTAIKEFPFGSKSPESSVGIRFLEERGGTRITDESSIGFSADTRKKTLAVHKTGVAYINPWLGNDADVTAIDTGTDILTIGPSFGDFSQFSIVGTAVIYFPGDFVTYPGGVPASTVFVIPIDSTHIKLATSYANAVAGTAINITSTGSLPASLTTTENPDNPQDFITHDVGYPPTYLLAPISSKTNPFNDTFAGDEDDMVVGALLYTPPTVITADAHVITFLGVQAVFSGQYAYAILKDPVELVL